MLVYQRVCHIPIIGEYLHFLSPYLDDILVNIYLFVSSAQFRPIRTTKNRLGRSKSDRLGRLGLISRGERFAKKSGTYRRIEATENGIYLMIYHDLSSKTEVGGQVLNSQWLGIWLGLGAAGLTSTLGWFRQLEANHLFRCSETRDTHGQALLGWMVKCLTSCLTVG